MAELASGSTQLSMHKPAEQGLAKARLLWALKPLGFLAIVLWVAHPGTSALPLGALSGNLLLGFIFGLLYGAILYRETLTAYIRRNQRRGRKQYNRIPQEFYWGNITKTLYDNS